MSTGLQSTEPYRFVGFHAPYTTQVPDAVFDELLPILSGAELKILLYIIRRTYGFKKNSDNISLSQITHGITTREGKVLDRGTGVSKETASKAVKSLEEKGVIVRGRRRSSERGDEATTYTLNFITVSENLTPPPVRKTDTSLSENLTHKIQTRQDTERDSNSNQHFDEKLQEKQDPYSDTSKTPALLSDNKHKTHPVISAPQSDRNRESQISVANQPSAPKHADTQNSPGLPSKSNSANDGFTALQAILSQRQVQLHPPEAQPEPREATEAEHAAIETFIKDFGKEFRDKAPASSVTQAIHLFVETEMPLHTFIGKLYEARLKTKQSTNVRNKMGYYFTVLRTDVLGLPEHGHLKI